MTSRPDLSYISEGEGSAEMEENMVVEWGTVLEGYVLLVLSFFFKESTKWETESSWELD